MPLSRPIPRAPQVVNLRTLVVIIASVAAGLLLRMLLDDLLGTRAPFLILLLSVSVSAVYGGLANGLLATALAAVAGNFFLIEPYRTLVFTDFAEFSRVILFAIVAMSISLLCESLRQSRYRAQELHRRALASHMEYRELVEAAGSMIVRIDLTGRITYVNRFAQEFFGLTEAQLQGKSIIGTLLPITDGEGHDLASILHNAGNQTEPPAVVELEHQRRDKPVAWVAWSNRPLRDAKGQVREILSVGMDITARKTLEHNLRDLTATLERRVAQRTEEVERTAQQLRALGNQLTRAEEHERRRLAQVLHDHLQQLLVAAKMRIASISAQVHSSAPLVGALDQVRDLLNQSIAESRSLTAELAPPILYDSGLGTGLDWLSRWFLEKNHLRVHVRHHEDQPQDIPESVRVVLFRAVRELLLNIVKHAGTDQAFVELDHRDAIVRLNVSDQGSGFNPDDIESRSPTLTGFGILSIRERVAALGGTFALDSTPGQGTRVNIVVPLQLIPQAGEDTLQGELASEVELSSDQTSESRSAPRNRVNGRAPSAERPVRVILADDHKILREGIVGMLELQPDIEVIAQASSGREAVELARQHQPDVVVMDINMPVMNGIEATRLLKHEMPTLCVIGLSMHTEQDLASAMRQAGAVNYLSKDGPIEDLILAIQSCGKHLGLMPAAG